MKIPQSKQDLIKHLHGQGQSVTQIMRTAKSKRETVHKILGTTPKERKTKEGIGFYEGNYCPITGYALYKGFY